MSGHTHMFNTCMRPKYFAVIAGEGVGRRGKGVGGGVREWEEGQGSGEEG